MNEQQLLDLCRSLKAEGDLNVMFQRVMHLDSKIRKELVKYIDDHRDDPAFRRMVAA